MCLSLLVNVACVSVTLLSMRLMMSMCVTVLIAGEADNELVCQLLQEAILDDDSPTSPNRSLSHQRLSNTLLVIHSCHSFPHKKLCEFSASFR